MKIVSLIAGFICIIFASNLSLSNGEKLSVFPNPKIEETEEAAYAKLAKLENDMQSGVESLIKWILPMSLRLSSEVELSGECMGSLLKTLSALKKMKMWAIEMLDASGKPGAGLLVGTLSQLGSYHECMRVVIPDSSQRHGNEQRPLQTGKFCVVSIRPPLPPRPKMSLLFKSAFKNINATFKTEVMNWFEPYLSGVYDNSIRFGLCIPSACQNEDLSNIVDYAAGSVGLNANVEKCEVPETFHMSSLQIVISGILLGVIAICLIATVISEVQQHCFASEKSDKESYTIQLLRSFSVVENFKKLMGTKAPEQTDCMNGIRYLSATWVVLGHAYVMVNRQLLREIFNFKEMKEGFFLTTILGAFMSVESFLLITGVLISYNIVKHFDSTRSYQPIIALFRRIWRFIPTILVMTGVMILLPLLTSGPDYKETMEDLAEACEKRWWANIIFINNFMPLNEMCMQHLWYVSVDIQLFLVSIVYFFLLFKNVAYGKCFLASCLVASTISSGLVTYFMEYPPATLVVSLDVKYQTEYFGNVYAKPHVHLGVYSVGLFLGTYLARTTRKSISTGEATVGWILATCVGYTAVYAVFPWNYGIPYTMLESVLFSATQRTVWGIALAWVVYACYFQKAGYVNNILSWPGFQPLVKISYGIYLVHVPNFFVYYYSRLGNLDVSNSAFVYSFLGTLVTSHILAVFLRLFYEAPCIELDRVLFNWLRSSAKNKAMKTKEDSYVRKNSSFKKEGLENGTSKIPV